MPAWSRSARSALVAVALTAAFGVSAAFSIMLTRDANGTAALWLATGFLAAALILLDRAWASGVAAACFVINFGVYRIAGDAAGLGLAMSAINVAEAGVTAWLARFACGPGVRLTSMNRVLRLLLMAVAPATAAASLLAANMWAIVGRSFDGVLATWFFADALGMSFVLPAILMMRQRHAPNGIGLWETPAIAAALAGLTYVVFRNPVFPLQLLLFPALILTAFRLGPRGAALGSFAVAATALACMLANPVSGLNPAWTLPERIRALQFLLVLVFFCSAATAMALSSQQRLHRLWAGRTRLARNATVRARASGRAKSEFLATVSHEIRTPMNSIIGFAEVLTRRDDLPSAARRQIELIARAGASLLRSVDDVLLMSKMQAGQIELTPRASSARGVAEDALAIVGGAARAKNLAMDLTFAGGCDQRVMMDDLRVRQVLLNLLSNAVKFTETGRVRLGVEPLTRDDFAGFRFTVTDTGIGIPEENLPQLFQRFQQLDSSTTRPFKGAGLGLAIAKSLVEAMGGRIGAERGASLGSVFWFEIPAPPALDAEAAEETHGLGARVLLVDDHASNRELGVTVLRLLGCDVDAAKDGREAVAAASTSVYDIILMDVHMPRMDGLDATRAIRELGGLVAATPIVAMSADVTPEMTASCLKAGMDDTLGKPIQISALHAMLVKWMGRTSLAHAAAA